MKPHGYRMDREGGRRLDSPKYVAAFLSVPFVLMVLFVLLDGAEMVAGIGR